jgi:hypothetical protein
MGALTPFFDESRARFDLYSHRTMHTGVMRIRCVVLFRSGLMELRRRFEMPGVLEGEQSSCLRWVRDSLDFCRKAGQPLRAPVSIERSLVRR